MHVNLNCLLSIWACIYAGDSSKKACFVESEIPQILI